MNRGARQRTAVEVFLRETDPPRRLALIHSGSEPVEGVRRAGFEDSRRQQMRTRERDEACLARLQRGEESALTELVDAYSPLLHSLAVRILRSPEESEEILQEAWLHVWRSVERYDARRGSVAAWLIMLVRSRALDRLRSRRSRARVEQSSGEYLSNPPPPATARAEERELRDHMRAALAELDPKEREVLEIAYFEGLSQSRIAERIGAPLGTVKSWTRQGIAKLRDRLPRGVWP